MLSTTAAAISIFLIMEISCLVSHSERHVCVMQINLNGVNGIRIIPLSKVPRDGAWALGRRDELPADRPGAFLGVITACSRSRSKSAVEMGCHMQIAPP